VRAVILGAGGAARGVGWRFARRGARRDLGAAADAARPSRTRSARTVARGRRRRDLGIMVNATQPDSAAEPAAPPFAGTFDGRTRLRPWSTTRSDG
jgi:shikimate 5-dehydrogenase